MTSDPPSAVRTASSPRLLLKNIVSVSAGGVLERLLGMIAGIFVRRALGPAPIGLVNWAAAIGSYPALLVSSGLGIIAKRDVARKPHEATHYVSLVLTLQLLLALLASSIMMVIALAVEQPIVTKWLLMLQVINLLLLPLDFTWLLHSREHMTPLAVATMIIASTQALVTILFVRSPEDLIVYAVITYPFRIALSTFQIGFAAKYGLVAWRRIRPTLRGAKKLVVEALPIGLSSVSTMLYYNSDAIILGATRGAREVGLYTTAYSLMLIPGVLTGAMINAYFPSLARAASNPAEARRISLQFLRASVWLGFPIAAMGWAIGRYPVVILYGNQFLESGVYFEWLCLNIALIFFNVGYSQPLNAWGAQKLLFYCTVAAGLTNLVANLLLIPQFGVPAAIATTLLAELVVSGMALAVRPRYNPIPWLKPVLVAGIVCVTAAIAARSLAAAGLWWLGGVLGACIIIVLFLWLERDALADIKKAFADKSTLP